jgi:hypothetical protein
MDEQHPVVLWEIERVEPRPVPCSELRPVAEEERDIGAEAGSQLVSRSSFASRRAVAASELPPPSPAATGIRFRIVAANAAVVPAASTTVARAARTSVSPSKPPTENCGACSTTIRSDSARRW